MKSWLTQNFLAPKYSRASRHPLPLIFRMRSMIILLFARSRVEASDVPLYQIAEYASMNTLFATIYNSGAFAVV